MFISDFFTTDKSTATPLYFVCDSQYADYLAQQTPFYRLQAETAGFKGQSQAVPIYTPQQQLHHILCGYDADDINSVVAVIAKLPETVKAVYLENLPDSFDKSLVAHLWANEQYVFDKYKACQKSKVALYLDTHFVNPETIYRAVQATITGRDCVNMPAEICHPAYM